MKSFKQYQEDAGGAGGAAAVGAASGGAVPTTTTAGIKASVENPPMGKKAQKKYVAAAMKEQNDPDAVEQQSKHRATPASVKQRLIRHKIANERETEHSLRKRADIVKNIPNVGTVPSSSSSPRKITGAVNMESFANFHKKSKLKAGSGVGPQTFMTKEDTIAVQKLTTAQNAKTDPNPTGFAKDGKDRLLTIGNQVLNKQKEKK